MHPQRDASYIFQLKMEAAVPLLKQFQTQSGLELVFLLA